MSAQDYSVVIGTEAEARRLIGTSTAPREGGVAVDEGLIQLVCASIHDPNPRYWGGGESPPAMLYSWVQDLPWSPGQPVRRRVLAVMTPLPGTQVANVAHKVEFHQPIRVGDRLSLVETLESISEEKSTPLGTGHFVVTRAEISRQDGASVAVVTNTLFRYLPA